MAGKIEYACPEKTKRGDKPDRVTVHVQLKIRSHLASDHIPAGKDGGANNPHDENTGDFIYVSV